MAYPSCIELNAMAVSLLLEGKVHEASSLFRQSIKALATIINEDVGVVGDVQQHPSAYDGRHVIPVSLNDKISTLCQSFSPSNCFVMYDKVFLVDSTVTSCNASNDVDVTRWKMLLSGVVLYNWGVASHYEALLTGSTKYIQRALKLYNKAFMIMNHQDYPAWADEDDDESIKLLCLAICNNIGYCSSCSFDATAVWTAQDLLQSILFSNGSQELKQFQSEYCFFYSSVIVLSNDSAQGAKRTILPIAPAA